MSSDEHSQALNRPPGNDAISAKGKRAAATISTDSWPAMHSRSANHGRKVVSTCTQDDGSDDLIQLRTVLVKGFPHTGAPHTHTQAEARDH